MKRRQFLKVSGSVAGGMAIPNILFGQNVPCAPSPFSVINGSSTSSSCPAGTAPGWFTAMSNRTWSTPVSNTPSSVGAPSAVTSAWTGGCVNQDLGEFLMVANGGHGDYSGNEVYAVTLRSAAPAWSKLNNASTPTGGSDARGSTGAYGDGKPRAVHGWNRCVYGNGRAWYAGLDGMYVGGQFTKACYSLRRSDLTWAFHGNPPMGGANWEAGPAAYDRIGNRVWSAAGYANSNGGYSVDASNGAITEYDWALSGNPLSSAWSIVAYDKSPRCWIIGSVNESRLWILNLENPAAGWIQRSTLGSPSGWSNGAGAVYHAPSSGILVYHHGYGTALRKLSVPNNPLSGSYTWSQVDSLGGATPPGALAGDFNGVFSKFNLVDDMGNGQSALCVMCNVTGQTYIYKLPATGV